MPRSVIGFHFAIGGNKTGIGNWIKNANSKGIPVGLKGANDYGLLFEASQSQVNNWLVYRPIKWAGVSRETPNYTVNPVTDAQALAAEFILKRPPEFNPDKVWVELLNEVRGKWTNEPVWNNLHVVDYLGEWCLAAAKYLNNLGYKFCGPSFNSGEPGDDGKGLADAVTQYSQPGMLKYLAYCAANPDKAALAVHDYVWNLPAPQYPQLWGRWEAAIAAADLNSIPRTFPIFVTEFGYEYENAPAYPAVSSDLDLYNQICARFPQVKFAASWTLQADYNNISNKVITWIDYPIDKEFDAGPQPAKTHPLFGGTLPGGTPMTLEQTLWNASQAEYTANSTRPGAIRFPDALGTWKLYHKNTRVVAAHNEIVVKFEGKDYSIQGYFDPFTKKLVEVGAWEKSRGHFTVTEPQAAETDF